MAQIVYEFNINDLMLVDHRWGMVRNNFFESCTVPADVSLPGYRPDWFEKSKNGNPDRSDDSFEFNNKLKSRIRYAIGRLCRVFSCRSGRGREGYNAVQTEWYPNNGKFQRRPGTSVTISAARNVVSNILNEDLTLEQQRGDFYYPLGGYREWHTNQYDPHGWRLYIVHTVPDRCASFQYIDPRSGQRHQCIDSDGCMRLFKISDGPDLLWHSITSDGQRWSLGFILNEQSAQKLIKLHGLVYAPKAEDVVPESV